MSDEVALNSVIILISITVVMALFVSYRGPRWQTERDLAEVKQKLSYWQDKAADSRSQLSERTAENRELEIKVAKLSCELGELTKKCHDLRLAFDKLSYKHAKLTREHEELTHELVELTKTENKYKDLREEFILLEAQYRMLNQKK